MAVGRFDRNGEAGVDENSKLQITNNKQITMTKIQNFKSVLVIEYWNLRFNCNLVLGIWDLEMFDYLTNRRVTRVIPYQDRGF